MKEKWEEQFDLLAYVVSQLIFGEAVSNEVHVGLVRIALIHKGISKDFFAKV